MTEERISPLRQRIMEDMRIRGMGDKAQKSHIRAIKDFAAFPWAVTRHGHTGGPASLSAPHVRHRGDPVDCAWRVEQLYFWFLRVSRYREAAFQALRQSS